MIGLKYIRNLHNVSMVSLAQQLNTTKQNISLWENDINRKIPKKHLPALSKIFDKPEDFFQKEIPLEFEIQALKELLAIKEQILRERGEVAR